MTDHKTDAELFIADTVNTLVAGETMTHAEVAAAQNGIAQAHALLHLADVIEGAGHDVVHVSNYADPIRFDPLVQDDPDPTTKVVQEVYDVRLAQQAQGWTAEHDLEHGAAHLKDLAWSYSWGDAGPMKSPREQMLISAALLIAAVEVLDRGGDFR